MKAHGVFAGRQSTNPGNRGIYLAVEVFTAGPVEYLEIPSELPGHLWQLLSKIV
jgi:hypothetical protein